MRKENRLGVVKEMKLIINCVYYNRSGDEIRLHGFIAKAPRQHGRKLKSIFNVDRFYCDGGLGCKDYFNTDGEHIGTRVGGHTGERDRDMDLISARDTFQEGPSFNDALKAVKRLDKNK